MAAKWLSGADPDDPDVLGLAFFIEEHSYKSMKTAVQNAIADAFKTR